VHWAQTAYADAKNLWPIHYGPVFIFKTSLAQSSRFLRHNLVRYQAETTMIGHFQQMLQRPGRSQRSSDGMK